MNDASEVNKLSSECSRIYITKTTIFLVNIAAKMEYMYIQSARIAYIFYNYVTMLVVILFTTIFNWVSCYKKIKAQYNIQDPKTMLVAKCWNITDYQGNLVVQLGWLCNDNTLQYLP